MTKGSLLYKNLELRNITDLDFLLHDESYDSKTDGHYSYNSLQLDGKNITKSLDDSTMETVLDTLLTVYKLPKEDKKAEPSDLIPVSVIDVRIKELEQIMDIIESYDHPEFLYEHKERLREWYIELKKLTADKEK